jgi:hypothetical protein
MQKIKYLVISILLLALLITYLQLLDYKNITSSLLQENTSLISKKNALNAKIVFLNDKIISLEESLSIQEIKLHKLNFTNDTNTTHMLPEYLHQLNGTTKEKSILTPNIMLNEENKITGFELEYKQQF